MLGKRPSLLHLNRMLIRLKARPLLLGLVCFILVALVGIGWWIGQRASEAEVTARPALWRVSQGDRSAYLFGTIHAVPRGASWLSPTITRAIRQSDLLILEVTGLDGERESRAIFERLGQSPDLLEISGRLDETDRARFQALERRYPSDLHGLARYESWAAALLINASAASGLSLSADQAGETVLTRTFERASKPIEGLETIEGQLGLFDRLPEADQRVLLAQSVREAGNARQLYQDLYGAWSRGDVNGLERQFLASFADAPKLRHVLIDARNQRWSMAIDHRLRSRPQVPFIAVGAGHLIGENNVLEQLARLGWRIERLQ